jgi:hypothetical protein
MIFCRPDFVDSARLFQLLTDVIALTPDAFATVYSQFRRSFEQSGDHPHHHDFVRKSLTLVNRKLRPAHPMFPGIDLPCWIEAPESDQTLVLLGQDPLRNGKYFLTKNQREVVLGTPYSAHSASLRERHPSHRYWTIIRQLHDAGYNLYLTDVRKFWSSATTASSSATRLNEAILESELDLVAPRGSATIVVTFGHDAAVALGAAFPGVNAQAQIFSPDNRMVLPVLHPSPRILQRRLNDYLLANKVNPAAHVGGIAKVIIKTIRRFRAKHPAIPRSES